MQLSDRVALVTGAGSGIGKAAALLLAREGARVAALSRTEAEVRETVEEIRAAGGEAVVELADISKDADIERAIGDAARRWGRLDIVFANAGVNGVWAPIEELAPDEWRHTLDINLTGTFLTIKFAVPHLKRQGGGAIVVTSSVNGTRMFSNTGATAYACTKAAQVALTKMLALELAPSGVRINVICPGAITTEIDDNTEKRHLEGTLSRRIFPQEPVPLGGTPGSAEDVARLVLFLVSDAAGHITGTEVWIDGAQSLVQG
jgi:NAD(P)-dependent dehydrogenase (short-subunit alcohol dehydrogenase family)